MYKEELLSFSQKYFVSTPSLTSINVIHTHQRNVILPIQFIFKVLDLLGQKYRT